MSGQTDVSITFFLGRKWTKRIHCATFGLSLTEFRSLMTVGSLYAPVGTYFFSLTLPIFEESSFPPRSTYLKSLKVKTIAQQQKFPQRMKHLNLFSHSSKGATGILLSKTHTLSPFNRGPCCRRILEFSPCPCRLVLNARKNDQSQPHCVISAIRGLRGYFAPFDGKA